MFDNWHYNCSCIYILLKIKKCLNCDFNMIFMIVIICHSELVSESPDINEETLKQVQGDRKKS